MAQLRAIGAAARNLWAPLPIFFLVHLLGEVDADTISSIMPSWGSERVRIPQVLVEEQEEFYPPSGKLVAQSLDSVSGHVTNHSTLSALSDFSVEEFQKQVASREQALDLRVRQERTQFLREDVFVQRSQPVVEPAVNAS